MQFFVGGAHASYLVFLSPMIYSGPLGIFQWAFFSFILVNPAPALYLSSHKRPESVLRLKGGRDRELQGSVTCLQS